MRAATLHNNDHACAAPPRMLAVCGSLIALLLTAKQVPAQEKAPPALFRDKMQTCPTGYRPKKAYCIPTRRDAPAAVPLRGRDKCPTDWRESGSYCIENRK